MKILTITRNADNTAYKGEQQTQGSHDAEERSARDVLVGQGMWALEPKLCQNASDM